MANWKEQEEEDLKLGLLIELSYTEMAEILGRSVNSLYKKAYKIRNPRKVKGSHEKYYAANKARINAYQKEHRKAYHLEYYRHNAEDRKAYQKEYSTKNRKKCNEACRDHYAKNKEVYSAYSAKRRAAKLNATPSWADMEGIKDFYFKRPEGYHVDHIVPLQHDKVCGLHVLNNLQYLTAEENLKKGNRYDL
jgi:hypothetical protein